MLGIALMVIAAVLNASASVLQRRATRDEPGSAAFSLSMLVDIARRPVWVAGILAMITGFVLHGVSISLSQLALVQPLLITELPFTLLLASWMFRMRLSRHDWIAIVLQSAGLATFVTCLAPTGGDARVSAGTWALAIGCTVAGIIALVAWSYGRRGEHRAALLGIATGAVFGLNSSLIAGVGASVSHGSALFTTWQTYAVAIVGPISFYLLQNALQAGNLVASQPGFTLANPLVSVVWGLIVFGENARGGLFVVGTVAGAALIGVGTLLLARSPMLDPDVVQEHTDDTRPASR